MGISKMQEGKIYYALYEGHYILKFTGDVRLTICSSLDQHLCDAFDSGEVSDILVDLTSAEGMDSTSLGLVAKLAVKADTYKLPKPAIVSTHEDINDLLRKMGLDRVFLLLDQPPGERIDLQPLPRVEESEEALKARIIKAHQILATLSKKNGDAFKDLLQMLGCQA